MHYGDTRPEILRFDPFNAIGNSPHMICLTSDGLRHSVGDAFHKAGLTLGTSIETDAPFLAESPATLECVTLSVTEPARPGD
ncbi:hypothetical protein PVT71_17875 [Salipiger sp. H15]|uniref:Uncharacterized protein n=1 Tax=Alloyangia sp. H15 TaxID=3029062 RepID=A0AAU8ANE8_9RHOB